GVTGQDVRDARLLMADNGAMRCTSDEWTSSTHHDAVREIQHTTKHYEVTDQTFNFVSIDDRDTLINDSFNDSFNSDDDGVDTDTTNVVAIQDNDTTVQDNDTVTVNEPVAAEPEPVEDTVEEPGFDEITEPAIQEPVEDELLDEVPDLEDEPDLDHAIG
ncbi:MAG TPA: hypothetical protein VFT95_07805, partial [Micromonosporaceae bacterium]|nr:hypothetical protein [Micromonosporaceae bacterium]